MTRSPNEPRNDAKNLNNRENKSARDPRADTKNPSPTGAKNNRR